MTAELRERVQRLLREIEWEGRVQGCDTCPSCCWEAKPGGPGEHAPDCELAAVLEELGSEDVEQE